MVINTEVNVTKMNINNALNGVNVEKNINDNASSIIKKLLDSAIANAENNNGMNPENLYIAQCFANKGPTMKRVHPRAQGRAYRIEKRTSHITVVLDER